MKLITHNSLLVYQQNKKVKLIRQFVTVCTLFRPTRTLPFIQSTICKVSLITMDFQPTIVMQKNLQHEISFTDFLQH